MNQFINSIKHRLATGSGLFILLCLLSPLVVRAAQLEAWSSDNDPGFTLPDLQDNMHGLQDYRGKVVLVNFWASWCPPCIHEMPALQKLKQQLADKPFEILTLNVGEKKYKVRKFTRLIKLELPVLLDSGNDTFNGWQVKTLPTSFLVDATGAVRYRVIGNPGWDNTTSLGIIDDLLNETLITSKD